MPLADLQLKMQSVMELDQIKEGDDSSGSIFNPAFLKQLFTFDGPRGPSNSSKNKLQVLVIWGHQRWWQVRLARVDGSSFSFDR